MIRFLQNSEIDRNAWDNCINNAQPTFVYALSWYLDLVSPGWCGLEEDNYSAVMPLPVKKKYGINYIMQPVYAQQLGVFSTQTISGGKIKTFLEHIPAQYKYIAINLNFNNFFESSETQLKINNNFELDLNPGYEYLENEYTSNTRRNLKKALGLSISFDGTVEELVHLKTENTGLNRKRIPPKKIIEFVSAVLVFGKGFICKATFENKTCAAVFFVYHQKRIYYLIPVSNPTGKEKKAMFAIIDVVIQKFAGSSLVLDFEGSNIQGLARFFEGFAAVNYPYPTVRINRLPFPLNKFRKS